MSSRSSTNVARIVRFTPGITRAGIAERLRMSVTTVNPLVAQLIDDGLVEETEPASASTVTRGRPGSGLRTRGDRDTVGVVVWGHGVREQALVAFDGTVIAGRVEPAPEHPRDAPVLAAVDALMADAAGRPGFRAPACLVVGLPGPYERGVGLAGAADRALPQDDAHDALDPFSNWFTADPLALLADRFAVPITVVNDANLGVLGEVHDGAAAGARCAISVRLSGHGIGAALAIDGELVEGSHGFAGEIAHVRVDPASDVICLCGSRGCLMQEVGPAMLRPLATTYGPIGYPQLLDLVDAGAPPALRLLEDAGRTIGRALAGVSTFLNPDVVVLDAGSVAASEAVLRGVGQELAQSVPPFVARNIDLRPSTLGALAPIRGALHVARAAATRSR